MPKNIKGGNKAKKGKNCRFREERQLDLATDGQYYGICTKYYGSARGDVTYICNNGTEESEISALGIIRGSIKKRSKLRAGDIVVVSPREYQSDKIDIVIVYNNEDYHKLKRTKNVHPKIISMRESIDNSTSENTNESSVSFNLGDNDESEDENFNEEKKKKNRVNQSYQDIYAGLPSLDDSSDEEDIEDL